jgi:hypothetical protein
MKSELFRQIYEKEAQTPSFIKIRAVESGLFHADRRTGMTKLQSLF